MSRGSPNPALLSRFKAFMYFTPAELEELAAALTVKRLQPGDQLFKEGRPADGCYLIADGRVRVTVARPGGPEQLAMLGKGDLVGQMALLDGGKRSATCTAVDPSVVLHMSREDFDQVFQSGSPFALKFVDSLTRMLVSQLRYANRRLMSMVESHQGSDANDPGVQSALKDVARRTLASNVDDDELDRIELVIPDGQHARGGHS